MSLTMQPSVPSCAQFMVDWKNSHSNSTVRDSTCTGLIVDMPSDMRILAPPLDQDPDGVNAAIAPAGTSNLDHGRHLNPAQLRRAEAVLRLHAALGHPCDAYLGRALDCNAYRGTSPTSKDLRNARSLHGPCAGCALGKIAEAPSPASTSPVADPFTKGRMDFVFIRGRRNHILSTWIGLLDMLPL